MRLFKLCVDHSGVIIDSNNNHFNFKLIAITHVDYKYLAINNYVQLSFWFNFFRELSLRSLFLSTVNLVIVMRARGCPVRSRVLVM